MTLEDLLKTKVKIDDKEITPEFRVAVQSETDKGIHFIIHPIGHNGTTLDFIVKGNELKSPFE